MKIRCERILDEFRQPGRCELCAKPCREREPHHVITRGAGGGDFRMNLVAIGKTVTWQCKCHSEKVDSKEGVERCRTVIAARERCSVEDVRDVQYFIVNGLMKHDTLERIREKIAESEMSPVAKMRCERDLIECGVLT